MKMVGNLRVKNDVDG